MQTTFTGLQTRGYRIAHNRIVTATLRWPCVCVHVDTIMRTSARTASTRIVTATLRRPCVCVHVDTIMRHVCVD